MTASTPDPTRDQVDAREYFRPLLRRKWLILATVIVVTAAAYVYTANKPERYRATAQLFIKQSEIDAALGAGGITIGVDEERVTANQAQLLKTPEVARQVAQQIDYQGDPLALLVAVDATPQEGKDFIDIAAVGGTGEEAADIANGFAQAFTDLRTNQARARIQRALRAAQQELDDTPITDATAEVRATLQSRLRQLNAATSLPTGASELVSPAGPASDPFEPRPIRTAVFGFFVALALAIAAAFGLERLDRRIKNLEEVERLYRKPMLGIIPRFGGANEVSDGAPALPTGLREPFRTLRVNIGLAAIDRDLKTLVVVSAVPNEGKSTVIRNLALAYAEAGLRVAVVESDLRKPMLARTLNVEPRPGITDVLAGESTVRDALKQVRFTPARELVAAAEGATAPEGGGVSVLDDTLHTGVGSVTLLTSGPEPPNPPVLGASEAFQAIIAELRLDHDIVLLDSAPMLMVADATPLVESADGCVVVTRFNSTTRDAARSMVTTLSRIPHANVLGVVCNQAPQRDSSYAFYGYGYGFGHQNGG